MKNTMKNALGLLALLWLAASGRVVAQENPYDVLGKALMPIASVFASDGSDGTTGTNGAPRSLALDAHLVRAGKLPPQLQGEPVHVALRTPDALLVQAPIEGQMLTVCRDGDALWGTPGSDIQSLIDLATATATPEKKKKKKHSDEAKVFGPLVLPVPRKDLVFLPVLFQVADAGTEAVAGQPCRVLDVALMPQLAKSLHAQDWTARVWIGANYSIVQVALTGPDWSGAVAIDKLTFPATLPDGTFQPQGTDVLRLTAGQFLRLMGKLGRE
jgi:hypothetical protein